jgi:hypothetical protein
VAEWQIALTLLACGPVAFAVAFAVVVVGILMRGSGRD